MLFSLLYLISESSLSSEGFLDFSMVFKSCIHADMIIEKRVDRYFPGCSFRCYHLFSHEDSGQNVKNNLTVGMGFYCLHVPCGT